MPADAIQTLVSYRPNFGKKMPCRPNFVKYLVDLILVRKYLVDLPPKHFTL